MHWNLWAESILSIRFLGGGFEQGFSREGLKAYVFVAINLIPVSEDPGLVAEEMSKKLKERTGSRP